MHRSYGIQTLQHKHKNLASTGFLWGYLSGELIVTDHYTYIQAETNVIYQTNGFPNYTMDMFNQTHLSLLIFSQFTWVHWFYKGTDSHGFQPYMINQLLAIKVKTDVYNPSSWWMAHEPKSIWQLPLEIDHTLINLNQRTHITISTRGSFHSQPSDFGVRVPWWWVFHS